MSYDPTAKPEGGDLATYQQHNSQSHQDYAKTAINGSLASAQAAAQGSTPPTNGEGVGNRY